LGPAFTVLTGTTNRNPSIDASSKRGGRREAAEGELPRHKRGAGYRYKREELDHWLLLG
jgi:hypothetical protein